MSFLICIPARYASSRLPGKALLKIGEKTLIRCVYEKCLKTSAEDIIVATDDSRIVQEVESFGGRACLTSNSIQSGSDRVSAATGLLGVSEDTILVNVQGDEPFMSPRVIEQIAKGVSHDRKSVHTVCASIGELAGADPNVVKVVRDKFNRALYFSRARIPWLEADGKNSMSSRQFLKHIGIYGYTVGLLKKFVSTPPGDLENFERLEQLRFLYQGISIIVEDAVEDCGIGVDTLEDYKKACETHESNI